MLKWLTLVVLVVSLGLFAIAYLQGRSFRHAGIIEGRAFLKVAARDLNTYGYVTNIRSSSYRFWSSSNVVIIGGTQYQCFAEIGGGKFGNAGTLAVTTKSDIHLVRQQEAAENRRRELQTAPFSTKVLTARALAPLWPARPSFCPRNGLHKPGHC